MSRVQIYDTTLRDGAQGEGVNFSLQDKLLIARRLDECGFDFVEGGYPLSNPKDAEFFQRIAADPLKNSRVCAFGMTRRRGVRAADDPGMKALIDSQAGIIAVWQAVRFVTRQAVKHRVDSGRWRRVALRVVEVRYALRICSDAPVFVPLRTAV